MTAFDDDMATAVLEIIAAFGVSVEWSQTKTGQTADPAARGTLGLGVSESSVRLSPPVQYNERFGGPMALRAASAVAYARPADLLDDAGEVFVPQKGAALAFPSGQKFTVDMVHPVVSGEAVAYYALGLRG